MSDLSGSESGYRHGFAALGRTKNQFPEENIAKITIQSVINPPSRSDTYSRLGGT